jgi:hypothetical protein
MHMRAREARGPIRWDTPIKWVLLYLFFFNNGRQRVGVVCPHVSVSEREHERERETVHGRDSRGKGLVDDGLSGGDEGCRRACVRIQSEQAVARHLHQTPQYRIVRAGRLAWRLQQRHRTLALPPPLVRSVHPPWYRHKHMT